MTVHLTPGVTPDALSSDNLALSLRTRMAQAAMTDGGEAS